MTASEPLGRTRSQTHIQHALDWIEDNLQYDICPADMARAAGYSEYHFLRLFKKTVGLTPADYIRKRRITEIVRRMVVDGFAYCLEF